MADDRCDNVIVAGGCARAVRKRDRRNTFARGQLHDAVMTHFHAHAGLGLTGAEAARSLRLPGALCDRLLAELVASGLLVRVSHGVPAPLRGRETGFFCAASSPAVSLRP